MATNREFKRNRPTRLWFVLPLVFGLLGGLIAYFKLKSRDKIMAKYLLILSLWPAAVVFGITYLIGLVLFAALWTIIGGVFTAMSIALLGRYFRGEY
jgi:peptidoglycan/LPS O-acetylase OafA/YrhL